MKAIHIIAALLVLAALALLFAGQSKLALGLFALSTIIEFFGSVLKGKSKNT